MVRNKRETGFELLRIIAMFLIGAVHVMNYGGLLNNAAENTLKGHYLIYAFFTVSVNVFVLISAYFMVTSKLKVTRILKLWLQVVTYSVITYLISSLFIDYNFSFRQLIKSFLPILTNRYWFFTAYFIMVLLSPFINKILNNSSKKECYVLSSILLVLVYLISRFDIVHVFNLAGGYSAFWFVILYIIAGTLRLHPLNIKKRYVLIVYILATLGVWMFVFIGPNTNVLIRLIHSDLNYTSPLVIISSVSLLLLFKDINLKNVILHNSICFVSSLTFGIYLLQESNIKQWFYFEFLKVQQFWGTSYSAAAVLLVALEIFAFGAVCELVRKGVLMIYNLIKKVIKNKKLANETNENNA